MKLTTIEQVQKRVGQLPAPRDLKVIDHVDEHARRWLSYASFGFIAFGSAGNIQLTAVGGQRGLVSAPDSGHLRVPLAALDDAGVVTNDLSFGALFLVSGMEETLRVNGRVSGIADGQVTLKVEECYLHCAKSFRRADFWSPAPAVQVPTDIPGFVTQSRFLVLATINGRGQADVSPRGDPGNFLLQEDDGFLCLADRPGNRRIDSFHNILEQPAVSVMALVPGCSDVLAFSGEAALCADEPLLRRLEVQGKQPNLVTRIRPAAMRIRPCKAIADAGLWPVAKAPEDLVPAEIFKAHMKQSKESSLTARVARAAVSLPGAVEKGLELDYKHNMY